MEKEKRRLVAFFRNFIYGVEDSLVSTVGLLSGIAIAAVPKHTILLSGVVLIFVEAFSMSVGSYLSEHSAEEYMKSEGGDKSEHSIGAAIIMFFSYFVSGFVPLAPYLILDNIRQAFWWSIIVSLIALIILGAITARISKENKLKSALRMFVFGGIAIALGVVVGQAVVYFG